MLHPRNGLNGYPEKLERAEINPLFRTAPMI
jgi:hypothetical protein